MLWSHDFWHQCCPSERMASFDVSLLNGMIQTRLIKLVITESNGLDNVPYSYLFMRNLNSNFTLGHISFHAEMHTQRSLGCSYFLATRLPIAWFVVLKWPNQQCGIPVLVARPWRLLTRVCLCDFTPVQRCNIYFILWVRSIRVDNHLLFGKLKLLKFLENTSENIFPWFLAQNFGIRQGDLASLRHIYANFVQYSMDKT